MGKSLFDGLVVGRSGSSSARPRVRRQSSGGLPRSPAKVLLCVSKASRISFRRRFLARCAFTWASYRAMRAACASSAWRARVASRKALLDIGILVSLVAPVALVKRGAAPQQVLLCRAMSGAAWPTASVVRASSAVAPSLVAGAPGPAPRRPSASQSSPRCKGAGLVSKSAQASEHVSDRPRRRVMTARVLQG